MNLSISQKDLENTRDRIFFILGTSRSGSTLLQRMLSSHSDLVIPPETHFFHSSQHLKKELQQAQQKEKFRNALINYWYDQKTRIQDMDLRKEEVINESKRFNFFDPVDLFTLQLTLYRVERNKAIVGEKTPRHMLHVPDILDAYPEAKIIALFRDPRAKAYSEIKAPFGSPSVQISAKRWRKYVQTHERMVEELPSNQYMMLRYTDLISDVKGALQKICTFLGVNFEEEMLNYHKRTETGFAEGEKSWKKQTLKPLQKNRNDEWKSGLSNWQISLIEELAGRYLKKMDYQKWNDISLYQPQKMLYQTIDFGRSAWSTLSGSRKEGYHDPNHFKLKHK